MIIIRYSEWNAELEAWRETLDELVAAHRFEQDNTADVPLLQEQEMVLQGTEEIAAFLKQLEKDINDWRAPRCGV